MSALEIYVEKMRDRKHEALRFEHWDDLRWSIRTNQSASDPSGTTLIFRSEMKGEAFREPYASLARALVCDLAFSRLRLGSFSPFSFLMSALRILYDVAPGSPSDLTEDHFNEAEALTRGRAHNSAVNVACKLKWIAARLETNGIIPKLGWVSTLHYERQADDDSQLPLSDEMVMAWAELSADPPQEHYDLIRQRLVDLMMCGGFRVNEACTLPRDTLVKEYLLDENGDRALDANGSPIIWTGLRYWPEKGGSGQTYLKPIPTAMAPIAERAVKDVLRISHRSHADALAHFEGRSPFAGDVPWCRFSADRELWPNEVAEMLGLKGNMMVRGKEFIRNRRIPSNLQSSKRGTRSYSLPRVSKGAVEEALRNDTFQRNCVPRENIEVRLHDCLFVLPFGIRSDRPGFRGAARLIADWEILSYLTGQTKFPSIFERRGIALPEGENFLPKRCRSWLTTLACEGSLHPMDLARWMGWTKVESAAPYDLRSKAKREDAARLNIENAGVLAPSAPTSLPPLQLEQEAFGPDQAGHVTPLGICRLHFDQPTCGEFVNGLNSGRWRNALSKMSSSELAVLIKHLERLIENTGAAKAQGDLFADNWLEVNKAALHQAKTAMHVMGPSS